MTADKRSNLLLVFSQDEIVVQDTGRYEYKFVDIQLIN